MPVINEATLRNWFGIHIQTTKDQTDRAVRASAGCEGLARLLLETCPKDSADRSAVMRSLRRLHDEIITTIRDEDL